MARTEKRYKVQVEFYYVYDDGTESTWSYKSGYGFKYEDRALARYYLLLNAPEKFLGANRRIISVTYSESLKTIY